MKKEFSGVAAAVYPLASAAAEAAGCVVWDVEFVKEGADRVLRITIDTDREGGIGIEDCEKVHREVDRMLDEADPIEGSYMLQITSPGIERRLTMPWHFAAFAEAGYTVANDGRYAVLDNVVVKGFDVKELFAADNERRLSDHRIVGCVLEMVQ